MHKRLNITNNYQFVFKGNIQGRHTVLTKPSISSDESHPYYSRKKITLLQQLNLDVF